MRSFSHLFILFTCLSHSLGRGLPPPDGSIVLVGQPTLRRPSRPPTIAPPAFTGAAATETLDSQSQPDTPPVSRGVESSTFTPIEPGIVSLPIKDPLQNVEPEYRGNTDKMGSPYFSSGGAISVGVVSNEGGLKSPTLPVSPPEPRLRIDAGDDIYISETGGQSGAGVIPNSAIKRPHIVVILADDLGWDDVSFHGSTQIPTPNIDALASSGIILNQHYSQPMCTPSRAALLTGKYPFHTGMQHYVIKTGEPWGLPLEHKILPEYLKEFNYTTHAVGKWHLGMFDKKYWPTRRGFDSHVGYMNGFIDYNTHVHKMRGKGGFDFFYNFQPYRAATGRYATEVFTERAEEIINEQDPSKPLFLYLAHLAPHRATEDEPFQAPAETVSRFDYVKTGNRSVYAAMVDHLDKSVGRVVDALKRKGMLENTIILFSSDNGGQNIGALSNVASNWPLRGEKRTLFEGGCRVTAFLWSASLKKPRRIVNNMLHITDWLPTLYRQAGGNPSSISDLDGFDMWDVLSNDSPSPRNEVVYNLDYMVRAAAIRMGKYKLIKGPTDDDQRLSGWFPTLGNSGSASYLGLEEDMEKSMVANAMKSLGAWWKQPSEPLGNNTGIRYSANWSWREEARIQCNVPKTVNPCISRNWCLFNLEEDPCEFNNIFTGENRGIVLRLTARLREHSQSQRPTNNKMAEPEAFPASFDDAWKPWRGEL